jgi:hypothetical protein
VENDILKDGYKEYRYFSPLEISTDASLWDVTFEGLGLRPVFNGTYRKTDEIFDDERYEYVILNNGSNVIPPMTYIKNDPNSTVVVTEATDPASLDKEDRTTIITVTAEDGSTTKNYYFDFYRPDGIATLDTIIVSEGKLYPDFSPEIFNYVDTIYGCCNDDVPTPEVTWVKSGPYQKVVQFVAINVCQNLKNKTRITVTSDNGVYTKYYIITFTVIDTTQCTGIDKKIYSVDFAIYPNPASEVLNFEHNCPMKEVAIYNMLGKEIRKYELNSVSSGELSLAGLSKGVYFIRMRDSGGQVYTRKVIKD